MKKIYPYNKVMEEKSFSEMDLRDKILTYSKGFLVPGGPPEEERLEKLLRNIRHKAPVKTVTMHFRLWAAVLVPLILLGAAGWLYFSPSKVKTELASQKSLVLPDQSEVILNAGSRLTYHKRTFAGKRSIHLYGEALLKVKKGSAFSITTSAGIIEILGTELNILSREDVFKVTCISGRVKVTSSGQSQEIGPGEKAELKGDLLVKQSNVATERIISWQTGSFYFEDTPLLYIFEEIERQYNVSIESQGLEKRIFTGSFSNKNLGETLNIVCIPMELSYEIIKGNQVVISSSAGQQN